MPPEIRILTFSHLLEPNFPKKPVFHRFLTTFLLFFDPKLPAKYMETPFLTHFLTLKTPQKPKMGDFDQTAKKPTQSHPKK